VKILAIETSMGRSSVAVAASGARDPALVAWLEAGEPQAEKLIPLIGKLMAQASLPFRALDRIAVCVGPGGFSGIRTGVAAARGIGLAADVPVVGVTSFRIMAAGFLKRHGAYASKSFGVAAPAGSNMIYCQAFGPGGSEASQIEALPHKEVDEFFKDKVSCLAGPAAAQLAQMGFLSLPVEAADLIPDAQALAAITHALEPGLDLPSPFYVRPADARPQTGYAVARKDD
jgi:tRNA threonylcarbamoyl adenosine modification protein YeaZ